MEVEKQQKNIKEQFQNYGKVIFSWKFAQFPNHNRDASWYVWGTLVLALVLIYSVWSGNILLGVIAILSSLIIIQFHRDDSEINFKITEDGILINKKYYPYKEIENFYIIYNPPIVKTLYLEPKAVFSPRIPILLEDQNPIEIREVLLGYLSEDLKNEDEPLSDQISRMFKL